MSNLFINVDLQLESENNLGTLIDELGDAIHVLRHDTTDGKSLVSFEVASDLPDAESTLRELLSLVERLSDDGMAIWTGCESRMADIGFQSSIYSGSYSTALQLATVRRLSQLDMGVTVTIYPIEGGR